MRIEDEIKQAHFRNPAHKAALNMIYSHHWLQQKIRDYLNQFNVTPQQFNVLRILRGQLPKPATVSLIRDRMLEKLSDASRIVERLRLKGLITRKQCQGDRREVEVSITQKGLALLKKSDALEESMNIIFSKLSETELSELSRILDKMRG